MCEIKIITETSLIHLVTNIKMITKEKNLLGCRVTEVTQGYEISEL